MTDAGGSLQRLHDFQKRHKRPTRRALRRNIDLLIVSELFAELRFYFPHGRSRFPIHNGLLCRRDERVCREQHIASPA